MRSRLLIRDGIYPGNAFDAGDMRRKSFTTATFVGHLLTNKPVRFHPFTHGSRLTGICGW